MNKRTAGIVSAMAIAILILDTQHTLANAQEAVELCIRVVIPSLFPFFLLCTILTSSLNGARLPFMKPLGRVLGIPEGAEPLFLVGILGGYPVGARCVSQTYEAGQLSREQAQRMMVFCNQCGPAFIFGMLGSILEPKSCWILWGITMLSAVLTALLMPGAKAKKSCRTASSRLSLSRAMAESVNAMARVCGWVIVFRLILGFLERWFLWLLPDLAATVIACLLEISNGCILLGQFSDPAFRFILAAGMISFGGLCVSIQTLSVISDRLDRNLYFPGKVLQCAFSLVFASLITGKIELIGIVTVIALISLAKIRKNSSIPVAIGV